MCAFLSTYVLAKFNWSYADTGSRPTLVSQVGHTKIINSEVFSPDGKFLLSVSDDTTARLWQINPFRQIRVFGKGGSKPATAGGFSPDQ
jgi:WD40 repeat protein